VGLAKNWPINSTDPVIGGVVVTSESWAGHVAIIEAVHDGQIDLIEANYKKCAVSKRTISTSSLVIKGFYNP
jgi:surface antigen